MEKIERLTRLNVEIEGLLRVLSNRDNSTAREMLNEKYNEFSALFCELMSELPKPDEADAVTESAEPVVTENNETKDVESAKVNDETDTGIEKAEEYDGKAAPKSADERAVDAVERVCDSREEPGSIEGIDESIIVPVELGDFPVEDEPVKQPVKEVVDEQSSTESEINDHTPTESENATLGERLSEELPSEIRVDEMIARRTAGDLTKAFTLNDKIRFRRSLFASDADEFTRVLGDLSDIETYSQATNYLAVTLGWDINNPEVEEFLTIIRPHYPKAD